MENADYKLTPGERLIGTAKLHWWVFAPAILFFAIGVLIFAIGVFVLGAGLLSGWVFEGFERLEIGSLIIVFAIICLFRGRAKKNATELAVTSKRVIVRRGPIEELAHGQIDSITVEQSLTGKLFGFGTVTVNRLDGNKTSVPDIDMPLEFTRSAMQAIEETAASLAREGATQEVTAPEPVRRTKWRAVMRWSLGIYAVSLLFIFSFGDRMALFSFLFLLLWYPLQLTFCIANAWSKGRSTTLGVVLGLLCFPPFGFLFIAMFPSRIDADSERQNLVRGAGDMHGVSKPAADSGRRRGWRELPLGEAAVIGIALAAILFAMLLAQSPDRNITTRYRVDTVLYELSPVRQLLADRCKQGTLAPGATDATPAGADSPGRYVRNIMVRVDDPKRPAVIATLNEIYAHGLLGGKSIEIPAGTTVVLQGQCEDREFGWKLTQTTLPQKYLKYLPSNSRLPAN